MKEVKDYNTSKDPRLIDCKTECGNDKCYARRYGLFAEKTCFNFVEPKIITNADRIRAMSDEQMVQYFCKMQYREGDVCPPTHECAIDKSCEKCWLDWLKQEATE